MNNAFTLMSSQKVTKNCNLKNFILAAKNDCLYKCLCGTQNCL